MQEPLVIYGKHGQVGLALAQILGSRAVVFASKDYDFSDINNINAALEGIKPRAIINASAYTDVNGAETNHDAAYKANSEIPGALAKYCLAENIPLVHFSTDYVFSGSGTAPHKEGDATAPLNVYGLSKLSGEEKIREVGGKYLIFRTSWVYNSSNKNFLTTMLKLGAQREKLSVVADQFGAPTYAPHLAAASLEILDKAVEFRDFPSGIYHLCGAGETSWHGFAVEIFKQARLAGLDLIVKEVVAITSEEFQTPALRPKNSRLDCSLILDKFSVQMPHWQGGLVESMRLGF